MDLLDSGTLSALLGALMVLLVLVTLVVVRFVVSASRRVAWVAVAGVLFLGAWTFRSELASCAKTCDCQILTRQIEVPACDGFAEKWAEKLAETKEKVPWSDTVPEVLPRVEVRKDPPPLVVTTTTRPGDVAPPAPPAPSTTIQIIRRGP